MACYHPMKGYICQDGKFRMQEKGDSRAQTIPCGQCVGCRLQRSRHWAIRCMHEASLYENNCFITLTYNSENLPKNNSLNYDDFQKFMKRLRFLKRGLQPVRNPDYGKPWYMSKHPNAKEFDYPIRFYMCGEYGENFGRPHFHALLFNFDFLDKKVWEKTDSGSLIYRSPLLEELWPYGYSSTADVTFQSAAYVSRYVMKKVTGKKADSHYETVDENGVVDWRAPEFNKMSLKPGIGATWFKKFKSDVYPNDYVILNGKETKPPRYYDKLYERESLRYTAQDWHDTTSNSTSLVLYSPQFDDLRVSRWEKAQNCLDDSTPERLAVREQVSMSKLARLKRKL